MMIWAPLFERGMTLRGPLLEHTDLEIEVMVVALQRFQLLKNAAEWDEIIKNKSKTKEHIEGQDVVEIEKCMKERDKLEYTRADFNPMEYITEGRKHIIEPWWYICARRGRRGNAKPSDRSSNDGADGDGINGVGGPSG